MSSVQSSRHSLSQAPLTPESRGRLQQPPETPRYTSTQGVPLPTEIHHLSGFGSIPEPERSRMMIDRATFVGLRGWKDLEGDPECADTDYYDGYANTDYYLMTRGDGVVVASMRLTPVVDISTCLSVNFFSCDAQRDRASATINRLLEDKTILDLTRLIPNVDMFANVSSQPAVKSGFIGILGTAVASAVKHNTFHPTRPIVWVFTVDGLVRNFLEQEMMIPNLSEVLTHTQSTESTKLLTDWSPEDYV